MNIHSGNIRFGAVVPLKETNTPLIRTPYTLSNEREGIAALREENPDIRESAGVKVYGRMPALMGPATAEVWQNDVKVMDGFIRRTEGTDNLELVTGEDAAPILQDIRDFWEKLSQRDAAGPSDWKTLTVEDANLPEFSTGGALKRDKTGRTLADWAESMKVPDGPISLNITDGEDPSDASAGRAAHEGMEDIRVIGFGQPETSTTGATVHSEESAPQRYADALRRLLERLSLPDNKDKNRPE